MEIKINQVGYRKDSVKKATITDSNESVSKFSILNAVDNSVVYTGDISDCGYYKDADENVKIADFSELNTEGSYKVSVDGIETAEFSINDSVYLDALQKSIEYFNLSRCGCELSESVSKVFAHKACHNTPARIYGTEEYKDVTGGWHDAGDYGRYVVPGAKAVVDLLNAYELCKSEYMDSISDKLLDEVKYELDFFLKMQDETTGGVYHKVTCASFPDMVQPEEETEELIICPVSYTATADFVATLACAYRTYSKVDKYKDYAEKLMAAAYKALSYIEDVEPTLFKNPEGIVTGEYDDYCTLDETFWAYAEMYKTTGDKQFEEILMEMNIDDIPGLFEWKDVGEYGFYAYVTAKDHSDKVFYDKVYARLSEHVDKIVASMDKDPYGYSMDGYYYWGCNMGVANDAMLMILIDKMNGTNKYSGYISELVNYLFGNNPNNVCYLTGVGSNPAKLPHHRPSAACNAPMPGMLVGGPEPRILDEHMKETYKDGAPAPAKCYADVTGSYSTNEVTIYWNSPLVFVLAYLA